MRPRTLVMTVACALLVAFPAAATRLWGGHPVIFGASVSINATLTLRATQTLKPDLSAALSGCTTGEMISASATGPVTSNAWYGHSLNSQTWRKRELLEFPIAATSGEPDGPLKTIWTFTCGGGSYIYRLGFNVSTPELLDWNYGAETGIRYGGYPLYNLTSDPVAANWAVSTVAGSCGASACSALWEIYGAHVVIKCLGTTGGAGADCPSDGTVGSGSYHQYSNLATATQAIATPAGDYSVILVNATAGTSRTVVMHMIPHQHDLAPPPSFMGLGVGNQLCEALRTDPNKHFGDRFEAETPATPVDYTDYALGSAYTCLLLSTSTPTQYSGGPVAPTDMDTPGWMVVEPREPFRARLAQFVINTDAVTATAYKPSYISFEGWDQYSLAQPGVTQAGTNKTSFFKLAHNMLGAINLSGAATSATVGDGMYNAYAKANRVLGDKANLVSKLFCLDCRVVGNEFTDNGGDVSDWTMFDSNPTLPSKSEFSFNFAHEIHDGIYCAHTDFSQSFFSSTGGPASLKKYVGWQHSAVFVGNVMMANAPRVLTATVIADFTASFTATQMTVTAVTSGTIAVGDYLSGDNVGVETSGTNRPVKILSQASGTAGGVGVYNIQTRSAGFPATLTARRVVTIPTENLANNNIGYYACANYNWPVDGGKAILAAQGLFNNQTIDSAQWDIKTLGNIVVSNFPIGIDTYNPGDGTTHRYDTSLFPYFVTASPAAGGMGLTYVTGANSPGVGSLFHGGKSVYDKMLTDQLIFTSTGTEWGMPAATDLLLDNQGLAASTTAKFDDPLNADNDTIAKILTHFNPKAGGGYEAYGAVGHLAVVDHRAWTYDPTYLARDAGIPAAPGCLTPAVVTWTTGNGTAIGDVATVTTAAAWNITPASTTAGQWILDYGATPVGTGTSFTIASAAQTRPVHDIVYMIGGTNTGGTGTCATHAP